MLHEGMPVVFRAVLRIPSFVEVQPGEVGWVEAITADGDVWVRMAARHDELVPWDNCAYLPAHMEPRELIMPIPARTASRGRHQGGVPWSMSADPFEPQRSPNRPKSIEADRRCDAALMWSHS